MASLNGERNKMAPRVCLDPLHQPHLVTMTAVTAMTTMTTMTAMTVIAVSSITMGSKCKIPLGGIRSNFTSSWVGGHYGCNVDVVDGRIPND